MIRRHLTPALIVFTFLLAGCLAAAVVGHSWWLTAAPSLVLAAVSIPLLRAPAFSRTGLLLLCAAGGLLLGAGSQLRMGNDSARAFLPMRETEVSDFSGTVLQDSALTKEGDTVLVLAMRRAASSRGGITGSARGSVLLFVPGDSRFSIGERLTVHASPVREDTFGSDAWTASARRNDIHVAGFTSGVWAFRAEARGWLHRAVEDVGYPASALLEALLIGVREDVPRDLQQAFKLTGSLHILALSGLHVTALYGVVAGALWFLRRQWLKFLAASLAILFFQFLAGFMPSLLRATVMILVGGTAVLLDRDREPLNLLALSGIVILLIDPWQVFSLSFQLSFLALGGILVVGALVQRPLAGRLPRFLLVAFAMSAGAQVATIPLVIGRFGAWYPSGLVAGILLVPLTTAYLWAGFAWLPLSVLPWPLLHDACARAFGLFYDVIRVCAVTLARVPGISFQPPVVPWLVAATGLAAVVAASVLPPRRAAAPTRGGV
jgi:competence protein ComEC